MRPLILVDAHNWIHRYWHAIPPSFFRGRNVAAVRALRDLVLRLRRDGLVLAVFDGGGARGGRTAILPSYKASRPETPVELVAQIEMAYLHIPRYGVGTVRVHDFEADDVIAELARRHHATGGRVCIVSGDKDLCALVRDDGGGVVVQQQASGEWRTIREAEVTARHGVGPALLLDLLALTGDDSDEIPGVRGIGPKTAAQLLRERGSLEGILAAADLDPRVARKLEGQTDAVRLARRVLEPAPVPTEAILAGTISPGGEP